MQQLFAADEAGVGGLIHAGLAGDGKGEAVAELRDGLDGIAAEVLAEENDDVGEVGFGDVNVGPEGCEDLCACDQAAVAADEEAEGVEGLGWQADAGRLVVETPVGGGDDEVAEAVGCVRGHCISL